MEDIMDSSEKVKSRWTRSFFTALNTRNDEEKYICEVCNKDLANPSNLMLHRNTHVIERPYKCEPCQVSFNTQGKCCLARLDLNSRRCFGNINYKLFNHYT